MKFYLIATLTYLTSFVYAGGFQGCLERVWLYQAYLIDELNDEADRTVGFRCKKWDDKSKPQLCTNDEWEACKPQRGSSRCNFDQLMVHLGKAPQLKDWDRTDGNGKLNVEETAKRCNELFSNKNQPVKNFPGFKAIKGWTEEFNDYIKKLAKKTNDTYKNKKTDANKGLWDDWDSTKEFIDRARAGDHGPYLIAEANTRLGASMTVHTQNLGNNPFNGDKWETVDWAKTANEAKTAGVPDVDGKINGFLADWYRSNDQKFKSAREHYQVFKSYKRVSDMKTSCRK